MLKFTDQRNFWHGYIIGHLEGYYSGLFEGLKGQPPSIEERQEIIEIVESFNKEQ